MNHMRLLWIIGLVVEQPWLSLWEEVPAWWSNGLIVRRPGSRQTKTPMCVHSGVKFDLHNVEWAWIRALMGKMCYGHFFDWLTIIGKVWCFLLRSKWHHFPCRGPHVHLLPAFLFLDGCHTVMTKWKPRRQLYSRFVFVGRWSSSTAVDPAEWRQPCWCCPNLTEHAPAPHCKTKRKKQIKIKTAHSNQSCR